MVDRSENEPSQEVVAEVAVEVLESGRKDRDVDKIRAQFRPLLVNKPQDDWCNGTDDKSVELFDGSEWHGCEETRKDGRTIGAYMGSSKRSLGPIRPNAIP